MKYCIFSLLLFASACASSPEQKVEELSNVENAKADTSSGKPQEASNAWAGKWERVEWGANATLEIIDVIADSIYFTMSASSGGNEGSLGGAAVVVDKKAVYFHKNEYDQCRIEFLFLEDSIVIAQKSGQCDAGNGVYYTGTYKSEKWLAAHPAAEKTLLTLGIFETKEQDEAFRALVGSGYDSFLASTQLSSEGEDLDGWKSKVTTSGVRGMYTIMENIIMIDQDNHIWAAVISDGSVLYYTNSPKDAATLPKTIEEWRDGFSDYTLVYASKPE